MNITEFITFNSLPESAEDILTNYTDCFGSRFKMAALSVAVLMQYEKNKDACLEMLNCIKGPRPLTPFEIQFLRDRLGGKMYVVQSYFDGTSVENNYTVPPAPYKIEVSDNPYSYQNENYAVLYLKSSGADSLRPVTLRQKPSTGEWFLWEITYLADIRTPAKDDPWA